jgi:enterobactin synthetase component D
VEEALRSIVPHGAGVAMASIEPRCRIAETLAGRACAIEAASHAGSTEPPRFESDDGPVWPEGFVGSVSHSRDVALAIAAPKTICAGIGVDIEHTMSFARAASVMDVVATTSERSACAGSPERLTLLFSAKESLYKCLHPIVRTYFDFDDAQIVAWNERERRLRLVLLRDLGPIARGTAFVARFVPIRSGVITSVVLPP